MPVLFKQLAFRKSVFNAFCVALRLAIPRTQSVMEASDLILTFESLEV